MRKLAFLIVALFSCLPALAQQIVVKADHADGIYTTGDKITWTVTIEGGKPPDVKDPFFVLVKGGATVIKKDKLDLSTGSTTVDTTLDQPNTALLMITAKIDGKPVRALGGAVADPYKIERSAPRPADFDAFWDDKIKTLRAILANPQVETGESGEADVTYEKVTLDNINNSHVYGQVARPTKEGKYPALLLVQYAGVYPLPKTNVTRRATQGWLAMDIMAHDLPLDKDPQFYKDQAAGPLKSYEFINDDNRDTYYLLRMLLGCVRSIDYLKTRPDWDGKTIVVQGTSQGGEQSLATAALCPGITAALACVPGGCDMTGALAGRSVGFPFYGKATPKDEKVMETAKYYDTVNFASRIKCPVLVATGLIDETCPPCGVMTAFNQITSPKQLLIMPLSNHVGSNGTQNAYYHESEKWLSELKEGKIPQPKLTPGQ